MNMFSLGCYHPVNRARRGANCPENMRSGLK
jgi:hypothetical protein